MIVARLSDMVFPPLACSAIVGCGALLTHFVDSRLPLRALANDGGAWPSSCQVASSAPASPCDFISAMKQFQWKIAVLAHKWARSQFSSSLTFRPQRTQLVSIAVTPHAIHVRLTPRIGQIIQTQMYLSRMCSLPVGQSIRISAALHCA